LPGWLMWRYLQRQEWKQTLLKSGLYLPWKAEMHWKQSLLYYCWHTVSLCVCVRACVRLWSRFTSYPGRQCVGLSEQSGRFSRQPPTQTEGEPRAWRGQRWWPTPPTLPAPLQGKQYIILPPSTGDTTHLHHQ
jgi:hypothetical protein